MAPECPQSLSATHRTRDGRWLALCCLQAGHYWGPLCECLGRPDLVTDPRFADHASLLANHTEASAVLCDVFAGRTIDDWRDRLESFVGQWTVVQDMRTAGKDSQGFANGYVQQWVSQSQVSGLNSSPPPSSSMRCRRLSAGPPTSTSTESPSSPTSDSTRMKSRT
jgi:crotonobetainyl-CoA:carnitine CoA-transferase CaiB-like acyl-CoA transferase